MAGEPIEEWSQPSPAPSDDGSSSSDEITSYKEEVLTPPIEKKRCTEEDKVPNYSPTPDRRPSTRKSRTEARDAADDEDRVS